MQKYASPDPSFVLDRRFVSVTRLKSEVTPILSYVTRSASLHAIQYFCSVYRTKLIT